MALYDSNGMMQAERLRYLINRFADKPEIVASLQRNLDEVLRESAQETRPTTQEMYDSEPDRYAADQGWYDTPAGYAQRLGEADKWNKVSDRVKAHLAKKGAISADQVAYDQREAEKQSILAEQERIAEENRLAEDRNSVKKLPLEYADFDKTINYNKIVDEDEDVEPIVTSGNKILTQNTNTSSTPVAYASEEYDDNRDGGYIYPDSPSLMGELFYGKNYDLKKNKISKNSKAYGKKYIENEIQKNNKFIRPM